MSRDLFVYHLCIGSCLKESNKRKFIVESQAYCEESKRQVFIKYYQMVSIHGLAHLRYKLLKALLQGFMG